MSDSEFQKRVISGLAAIKEQLKTGERIMLDHEERMRGLERDRAELKGRVAIIAAVIAAAFSLFCIWIGKRL